MGVSYNIRPVQSYRRGKKDVLPVRILKGLFPIKGDGAFEVVRKLIFLGAFVCFVYFGGSVLLDVGNEYIQMKKNEDYISNVLGEMNISEEVANEVIQKVPTILPEYIQAYYDNDDLVGHVRIESNVKKVGDTDKYVIDYPVYQAEDNDYYLYHAFDHSDSKGGAIFADWRNRFTVDGISANTILYGHNIFAQTYFTKLSRYYTGSDKTRGAGDDLDFYKEYPVVTFNTLYEKSEWKIFACGFFNTQEEYGDVFDYTNMLEFQNKDAFNTFILGVMDRSVLFTDVDLTYGDSILTLSTCYYPMGDTIQSRCVVFARKVRENENPGVDVSKAVLNTKELRFEEQAKRYGTNWNGRVWETSYLLSYEG